jgi:hypothetical protein
MNKLRLPIANPCHEDWDAMNDQGGGRRFCDVCTKAVHDLSDMTENEAKVLLDAPRPADGLCIRFTSNTTGQVRFRTPSTRAPAPPAFVGWRAGVAAGIAAMAMTGCTETNRAPKNVTATHCTYEVGPFDYTLARGEGNCPATEAHGVFATDPEPVEVMGKMEAVEPDPVPEMGEMVAEPEVPVMGQAVAKPDVPCEGDMPEEALVETKGDVAAPVPEPKTKMGKVAPRAIETVEMGDLEALPSE